MTRRYWIALAGLPLACSRKPQASALLPPALAGWTLRKSSERQEGQERLIEGTYEGPGAITVSLRELKSSAMALDAVQRWKPEPDTVFFYKDNYFALVRWQNADRAAVGVFVRALEKHIGQAVS